LIHQDARIFLATLDEAAQLSHELADARHAWLQILRGSVMLNGHDLKAGDGAAVSDERQLTIRAQDDAEVMLFDLA
jgi:redox-sensitive bicupin YhaK (pirin superfamily)